MNLTLQRGGYKHPVHTVVWEGFSSGHLNFELSAAKSARHSTTGGDFATRAALVTPRWRVNSSDSLFGIKREVSWKYVFLILIIGCPIFIE
jgi:hypothetical protein